MSCQFPLILQHCHRHTKTPLSVTILLRPGSRPNGVLLSTHTTVESNKSKEEEGRRDWRSYFKYTCLSTYFRFLILRYPLFLKVTSTSYLPHTHTPFVCRITFLHFDFSVFSWTSLLRDLESLRLTTWTLPRLVTHNLRTETCVN